MMPKRKSSFIDTAPTTPYKPSMRDDLSYSADSAARTMLSHHPVMEKTKAKVTNMLMQAAKDMHSVKMDRDEGKKRKK